jgi:hypothetical protein
MKVHKQELRRIIRSVLTELFVRPKHKTRKLSKAFSSRYDPGYDDDYLSGDIGFGEFEEADDDLDDERSVTTD